MWMHPYAEIIWLELLEFVEMIKGECYLHLVLNICIGILGIWSFKRYTCLKDLYKIGC
ncbi:hypothetical protein MA16_Dca024289 [Dendrobium catenatum]|uniref:Uncharacterized protein n=1 Tax=Dendrobium catenatum TaxID=906689 RepID=A0A2I0VRQ4_9ASPA|nr:hypothetical protein MA16_Dca024289 [Dendrobium catenatum]